MLSNFIQELLDITTLFSYDIFNEQILKLLTLYAHHSLKFPLNTLNNFILKVEFTKITTNLQDLLHQTSKDLY